jgi:4-amino-4-deoxy-L-arabinose transferase-like glycosyltransferase
MLRFWALSHGLPCCPGVDEPEVMDRAVRMMHTGDFNPHFFDYPSLYMYVEAIASTGRFLFGAMQGKWSALAQAPAEEFYLWGRAVTAIFGTATVWIVYRIGIRWSRRTALLAAVMLAVMPLHVRESHYTLTDVPTTFFVMLTLLLSLRAHERSTLFTFAIAGAAAGLAGATKYTGVVAVIMPLLACAMTPAIRPSRPVAMLWVIAGMLLAFLVAAPYTLLDLPTFLNQFARLASEYRAPAATAEPLWIVYLKHLRNAFGWPGSLIVIAGVTVGVLHALFGSVRLRWILATVFPLAYFYFISHQNIVYGRYLLPLLPFLSLLGAAAVVWIVGSVRHLSVPLAARNAVTVIFTLLAIVPPAYTSIRFNANESKRETREQAYWWILGNLPKATAIRIEGSVTLHLPPSYKTTYAKQLRYDGGLAYYKTNGIKYLVASSQVYGPYLEHPEQSPVEYADYQQLFGQTVEVARFFQTPDHPGPDLRILRLPD